MKHPAGDIAFEDASALIGDLTVEETFSTCLSLRRGTLNAAQRAERVHHVTHMLGLDTVKQTIIGTVLRRGLSGGQCRRVSLGREMLQPSALLMLDEPTSGLDATAAYSFVAFLQSELRASDGRRGALISLQQPNRRLLSLVDNLLLLGAGGVLIVFLAKPPGHMAICTCTDA
jgi:ABC-type multidrug transport system ATPase subunit